MRITTQGDYGLVCMLKIAQQGNGKPVSIQMISGEEQLPIDYIEQLLLKLRRAGVVKSIRGRTGGYMLARPASKITVKNIVEAVEGSVFETVCVRIRRRGSKCIHRGGCLAKPVWLGLKRKIEDYLDGVTLKELLNSQKRRSYIRK